MSNDLSNFFDRIKSDLAALDEDNNRRIHEIRERLIHYAIKLAPTEFDEVEQLLPSPAVPARPVRWIILLSEMIRERVDDLVTAEETFSDALWLAGDALQDAEGGADRAYELDCQSARGAAKAAASSADLGNSRLN